MKITKKIKWAMTLGLLTMAAVITLALVSRPAQHELSRAELGQLRQTRALVNGRIAPMPYASIYQIEGIRQVDGKPQKVFITTHLDDAQIKALFEQPGVKVDVPGQGLRGQWINICGTLVVSGLVIAVLAFQTNVGRGKSALSTGLGPGRNSAESTPLARRMIRARGTPSARHSRSISAEIAAKPVFERMTRRSTPAPRVRLSSSASP